MPQFTYKAIDQKGLEKEGAIDAVNEDVAIASLQRRGLIISSITDTKGGQSLLSVSLDIGIFKRVSGKEVVILSRQIATLFEAQVSALRVFRLLATETQNQVLQEALIDISDDLQSGSAISAAMGKHPEIFTTFYVNMVRAGEETGKLDQTFAYLADYLDRTYEVTSKARNALIYPAFVVFTFIVVMILMLTYVIPKIGAILEDAGQDIPIYTKIVLALSNFFVHFGVFALLGIVVGVFFFWRWTKTPDGAHQFDSIKLKVPYIGELYRKLYLSRLSDNLSTMLTAGIPMIKSIEVTATVIDSPVYEDILTHSLKEIKNGAPVSKTLGVYPEIPGIVVQMIRVGEETGELGKILNMLSKFYRREVTNAVDTLVGLIEPVMIVMLAGGVGVLLASVLIPIYNISTAI
jgi:type IV pilus assembly protein PilC